MRWGKLFRDLLLVALVLGGLYTASSQPYEQQDMRGTINQWIDQEQMERSLDGIRFAYGGKEISLAEHGAAGLIEFFIRKGTHFLTFTLLALLLYRLLRHICPPSAALPWSGLLSVVAAVLDEWHQTFTPNRTGMLTDVILDASGVFTAMLLLAIWQRRTARGAGSRAGRKSSGKKS